MGEGLEMCHSVPSMEAQPDFATVVSGRQSTDADHVCEGEYCQ